eukprot:6714361-Pyramimonas_sp.AAC.1
MRQGGGTDKEQGMETEEEGVQCRGDPPRPRWGHPRCTKVGPSLHRSAFRHTTKYTKIQSMFKQSCHTHSTPVEISSRSMGFGGSWRLQR